MNSFHQSRGRSFFDLFCAVTIAAAAAAGWMQTGATAWLAIAGVVLVQALVHVTDRRVPDWAPARSGPLPPRDEPELAAMPPILGIEAAQPAPAEITPVVIEEARPRKRSRKKAASPVAVELAEEPVVEVFPPAAVNGQANGEDHGPIAPLFEPQPLARQQRTIFGRKAG